jgi:hypothetical protein
MTFFTILLNALFIKIILCQRNDNLDGLLIYYENILENNARNFLTQNSSSGYDSSCIGNINNTLNNSKVQVRFQTWNTTKYNVTSDDLIEIGSANSLFDRWKAQMNESILWQYSVFASSDTMVIYPPTNWNCSADYYYSPKKQPYYISGLTNQKAIVLMIDISATGNYQSRISSLKIIASEIIKSLSFRDYIMIVPYDVNPHEEIGSTLLRATYENVAFLLSYIETLTPKISIVNNGLALQRAYNILGSSEPKFDCTKTIIILSSGSDDIILPESRKIVNAQLSIPIFGFLIEPILTPSNIIAELACASKGIYRNFDNINDAFEGWKIFITYLASFSQINDVRWSEPYDDLIDPVTLVTGAFPIYKNSTTSVREIFAILFMDLPLSVFTFNDTLSRDYIANYLLNKQICTPLTIDTTILLNLQNNICQNLSLSSPPKTIEVLKSKDGIMVATIIYGLFMILIPIIICGISYYYDMFSESIIINLLYGFTFIVNLICVSVALSGLWNEEHNGFNALVIKFNYDTVIEKIQIIDENPYKCCEIQNCMCSETNAPSCSSLINQKQEGTCSNGYRCCSTQSYQCNPRQVTECGCYLKRKFETEVYNEENEENNKISRRAKSPARSPARSPPQRSPPVSPQRSPPVSPKLSPPPCYRRCTIRTVYSTCSRCTSSVQNSQCQSSCGTCYSPIVTSSYKYNGKIFTKQNGIGCGKNDRYCVENFVKNVGPIGKTTQKYVNPENPSQTENSINERGIVMFIVGITISSFMSFCITVIFFCQFCRKKNNIKHEEL